VTVMVMVTLTITLMVTVTVTALLVVIAWQQRRLRFWRLPACRERQRPAVRSAAGFTRQAPAQARNVTVSPSLARSDHALVVPLATRLRMVQQLSGSNFRAVHERADACLLLSSGFCVF
jgi:hypothetical protein